VASLQEDFLRKAAAAASAAGHPFPEYAACEAALESAWGQSGLATRANNLFGQKQSQPPLDGTGTLSLPTKEFLSGNWVTVNANWALFSDWSMCFHARMRLLQAASRKYPHYAAALAATTGEDFVREVSQTWSTDPARASKVLSIYAAHHACFAAAQPNPAAAPTVQTATAQPASSPPAAPVVSSGLG
jgi:flagellum-specific peptidoglycan hydrolase FlgJ